MMSPSKSTERLIGHDKLANNGDDVNVAVCRAKRRGSSSPRLWRSRWRCDDEKCLSVTSPRTPEAKIWLTQNAKTKQTIRIFWNILFFFKCVACATICQMRHVCDDLSNASRVWRSVDERWACSLQRELKLFLVARFFISASFVLDFGQNFPFEELYQRFQRMSSVPEKEKINKMSLTQND